MHVKELHDIVLFQWEKQHELNLWSASYTVEAKKNIIVRVVDCAKYVDLWPIMISDSVYNII